MMGRFLMGGVGVALAVASSGCASARPASVPGHAQAFHINCYAGHSQCIDKAGEVCPNGYDVISDVASNLASSEGTGMRTGEMTVACTSGSGDLDDAPAPVAAAPAPAPAAAKPDPPTGAAGFLFEMAAGEAQATCEQANLEWSPASAGHFSCSGAPVGVGMDATTLVKVCDSGVCAIQLASAPEDRSTWIDLFKKLQQALSAKYGEPDKRKVSLPNYCSGDRFEGCLADGSVQASLLWAWPTGEKVQLFLGKPEDADPLIRIIYQTPAKSAAGL